MRKDSIRNACKGSTQLRRRKCGLLLIKSQGSSFFSQMRRKIKRRKAGLTRTLIIPNSFSTRRMQKGKWRRKMGNIQCGKKKRCQIRQRNYKTLSLRPEKVNHSHNSNKREYEYFICAVSLRSAYAFSPEEK